MKNKLRTRFSEIFRSKNEISNEIPKIEISKIGISQKIHTAIENTWLYTKYQIVSKIVLSALILPVYTLILNRLMYSSGRHSISGSDYLDFLFRYQGFAMLVFTILLLAFLVGVDLNAFIIGSALLKEKKIKPRASDLLLVGIRSLRSFFRPSGVFIMLWIALVIPLVGVGITVSSMRDFQIPNFITEVIFSHTPYLLGYLLLLAGAAFLSIRYIFTFHCILLCNKTVGESLRMAKNLMKRHYRRFVKDFIILFIVLSAAAAILFFVLFAAASFSGELLAFSKPVSRTVLTFALLLLAEIVSFLTFLTTPLVTSRLTELFYRYNELDGTPIRCPYAVGAFTEKRYKPKRKPGVAIGLFLCVLTVLTLAASVLVGIFFDFLFPPHTPIAIIAHRGGGDLGAENSLAGLHAAIEAGAERSEIDVQRTADGVYIIHHDATFLRSSGSPKKPYEMTFSEVAELEIRDEFDRSRPNRKVGTLEEFMDAAKGKIRLYIELKGRTADEQMVDDVVAMIRKKEMVEETAILSLDYRLIEYTEKKYPEIETGYLYFFAIGSPEKTVADILIMEEREATDANIRRIHDAGKEAIVWTVNKDASIAKFVRSEVDGIITDYVLRVQEGIRKRDVRSDFEILIDALFH